MGRDWSWLGGGGKKKSSSKSNKDIKPTPSLPPTANTATAAGCMSAVFNIFDLHHLQFPINHHHLHLPNGVDAPRNSLEEEKETPLAYTRKDGNLNISMGIKIKTKPQSRTSITPTESYSPSTKTPTLVARLMGLDLVPENYKSSPTPSSSSSTRSSLHHTNKHRHYSLQRNSIDGGTRSLPETPRISLGRRSMDLNYEYQRSSVHLKDNNNVKFTRVKEMKIHEDKENRSPREYAKQIVMQLKENVSRRRKMGTDITNKEQQQPRETQQETKKASKITKPTSPHTNILPSKIMNTSTTVKAQDKMRLPTVQEEPQGLDKQRKYIKKCKKPENYKSRLVKPPQTMQEEPFVRCSSKKTPLSINDVINFPSVPSLHTIKKQPHKSVCTNHTSLSLQSNIKIREPQQPRGELEYITRILRRTGIDRDTPISYAKWFSPSHPLDPSIFYFLEHHAITRPRNSKEYLSLRCNRKLLFHLLDEILADILKPHFNLKPWTCHYPIRSHRSLKGSELSREVSQRIKRFPLAECVVLEDIDALVAGDFPTVSPFEEEGEGLVTEIERGIIEALVTEMTTEFYATWTNNEIRLVMSAARGEFT